MLRGEGGHRVLTDNGSANGIFSGSQRVGALPIYGECAVRLGHPVDGLVLTCAPRELGDRMDLLALILTAAALIMFGFAASGRELRRFNEIARGLVFLTAAPICQFTSITNLHVGR